jgi:hypothetical protein
MLSGPGALLLPKCFRHRSYVILSNVFAIDAFISPRFSSTKPSRSYHGYCLTPHTQSWSWFGWWWQVGVAGWLSMDCWIYISSAMSFGLVSMFPCLSLILSKVVFSVFLKITLCILLGSRFKVFPYLEISFLQLIVVCFVMMSRAFFLVVLPMVSSVFIHSLISVGSFSRLGIVLCG